MRNPLSQSVVAMIDIDGDVVRQFLLDPNIFRHAFGLLTDRDPRHTFVCFGELGAVLMGAANISGINSIIWVPDWTDPDGAVARIDPAARTIVAIIDRLGGGAPYQPQCWEAVAIKFGLTPLLVSEVRCIIDEREADAAVSAASIEATKLVRISSVLRRADMPVKAAKSTG